MGDEMLTKRELMERGASLERSADLAIELVAHLFEILGIPVGASVVKPEESGGRSKLIRQGLASLLPEAGRETSSSRQVQSVPVGPSVVKPEEGGGRSKLIRQGLASLLPEAGRDTSLENILQLMETSLERVIELAAHLYEILGIPVGPSVVKPELIRQRLTSRQFQSVALELYSTCLFLQFNNSILLHWN